MKRLLDLFLSLGTLIIFCPAFLLVAMIIKLDSSGPVFFKGLRVGRNGRLFFIYKFRSMRVDLEGRGPRITKSNDLRITRLGVYLRRYKIDEWPQLLNIVRGEMSLVGPRPEDPYYVAKYSAEERRVLTARPGITSPASLEYRGEEDLLKDDAWEKIYLEEILPHKLALELEYLGRRNFISDFELICRTLNSIFRSLLLGRQKRRLVNNNRNRCEEHEKILAIRE